MLAPTDGNAHMASFEEAAARGVFVVPRCEDCGRWHWYPRPFCPFCHGRNVAWRRASGDGIIYAFSIFRRLAEPYAIAYVTLAEGPRMLTNIIDCDFDRIAIGERVRISFATLGGARPMPAFTLA